MFRIESWDRVLGRLERDVLRSLPESRTDLEAVRQGLQRKIQDSPSWASRGPFSIPYYCRRIRFSQQIRHSHHRGHKSSLSGFRVACISLYGSFQPACRCSQQHHRSRTHGYQDNFPKISLVIYRSAKRLSSSRSAWSSWYRAHSLSYRSTANSPFFPLSLIPLLLLTLDLDFSFFAERYFRDTLHVVSLFTTFLLFISPVLYRVTKAGLCHFSTWTVSYLIIGCRDVC